ncbi:MAG: serine O-acetyltransferase [Coriobacteriales bacterium]
MSAEDMTNLCFQRCNEMGAEMFNDKVNDIVDKIADNYDKELISFNDPDRHFPNREKIIGVVLNLRRLLFPGYFGDEGPCGAGPKFFIGYTLTEIEKSLHEEVKNALLFEEGKGADLDEVEKHTSNICSDFFYKIPELQEILFKDVEAAFDGDPAASSREEIIFSYPGFFAIFVYRIAHELCVLGVPLIPRIMSEYAHGQTGVDINPGAKIGEYFFIDHATGVVIGETCEIGNHVKIYQGVTLGALSTRAGQRLRGVKRHPTVEDNVTIYSNASVLGGDTVIGEGTVISGSAFVTESTPKNSRVSLANQEVQIRTTDKKFEDWEI